MVIRTIHGKQVVCQHVYGLHDMVSGSEWIASSGLIVKIDYIDDADHLVYYSDANDSSKRYMKDSINFQLKYSKII